jgi:hypothetical protein
VSEQPERGGAWDYRGTVRPEYSPKRDRNPDPGEVVWAWVPFEEDHGVGKDRPLLVIGRDATDPRVLVGLMLSSKPHDGRTDWCSIGAGPWDREHRPSWVRLDRPLGMHSAGVRREGATVPSQTFHTVVSKAVSRPHSAITATYSVPARRGLLRRIADLFRR